MNKRLIPWLILTTILTSTIIGLLILFMAFTIQLFGLPERANSIPRLSFLPLILFLLIALIPLVLNLIFEAKTIISVKNGTVNPFFNNKIFITNIGFATFIFATFIFTLIRFLLRLNFAFFYIVDGDVMIFYSVFLFILSFYPFLFCIKFNPRNNK